MTGAVWPRGRRCKGGTNHGELLLNFIDIELEMLLDAVEFMLVGVLGLLPILVVTLAERLRKLRLPRPRIRAHLNGIKIAALAALAWASQISL